MNGFSYVMTVMDYYQQTLAGLIVDPELTLQKRFEIVKQIGLGIQYMHIQKKTTFKILRP